MDSNFFPASSDKVCVVFHLRQGELNMDWKSPFVVYRITSDGKLRQVYVAEDFKAASYWLTYIAEAGDVLCKTPLHKKHSRSTRKAEYWSHKGADRVPVTDQELWKEIVSQRKFDGDFPDHQIEDNTSS
jgi:hypothetical protein